MNGKKSRALRRAVGFHPADRREVKTGKPIHKLGKDVAGKQTLITYSGTVTSTGARQQYQKAKRTPGLLNRLLGGAA
jgi:hypothetical protein